MNSANADHGAAWTTAAPAKLNLDLRLHGRRADGYHLLSTVLQSVALADGLTLTRRPGPFSLTCDAPGVPVDATNLAWRGAAAMAIALNTALDGWTLHLEKRVPAEAGLGGGSSDAVAAARLVAAVHGRSLAPVDLETIVRPLGADVAFFAWGGTVRGEGVGDVLTPLDDVPAAAVVIVRPPFGVATREAYGWYDAAAAGAISSGGPPGDPSGGPAAGRAVDWRACRNDLEPPVTARHPEISHIVSRLRGGGAWLAAMSGSGSACFGVYAPGKDLSRLLTGWPPGTRVWTTGLVSRATYAALTRCQRVLPA